MIKKFTLIALTTLALTLNVHASSDGDLLLKKNDPAEIGDCSEKFNRATFAFNQTLDGLVFKPVSSLYRKLPSPVKSGVSNSLDNLSNLVTIPNNILQGDFKSAGVNTGRFIVNSTVGVLGLMDVATGLGIIEYEKEDYGQSLAKHGVGPGCYIVLPVLGPSTARDTIGSLGNFFGGDAWYNVTVKNDTHYFSEIDYYSSKVTGGVDFRAKNLEAFDAVEKNSVDLYATVRSLYLQDRKKKINNSSSKTEAMEDGDWDTLEN